MSNSVILFLWFLAGSLSSFSWYKIICAFMSGGRDTFERFGSCWIILTSLSCGSVTWMLCFALIDYMQHSKHWWFSAFATACLLLIINSIPIVDGDTSIFDRAIAYCGYLVSRICPYESVDAPLPRDQKFIIPPNHKLIAATSRGEIEVIAGNGTLRTITWGGVTREIALSSKERNSDFEGFDFRSSAANPSGYIWKMHKGIAKCHYSELFCNYDNNDEAVARVKRAKDGPMPKVVSSDGLIVGWSTKFERGVLSIFITQILVNGKKPSNLAGADDSRIALTPCK